MDQERFAFSLKRAGRRVVRSPRSYRIDGGGRVFPGIASNRAFALPGEPRDIHRARMAFGRKLCTLTQTGSPCDLSTVEDKHYRDQNLRSKHPGNVRTAYTISFVCGSTCPLLHKSSRSSLPKTGHSRHVPQCVTIQESIRCDGIRRASGGFESLVPVPGPDRLKRYSGNEKIPLTIRILLRPPVRLFWLHPGPRAFLGPASPVSRLRHTAIKALAVLDLASRSADPEDPAPGRKEKSK